MAETDKMEPRDFAFWLQGFAELNGGKPPTEEQWASIIDHLKLVFTKVTPVRSHYDLGLDIARRHQSPYLGITGTPTGVMC